MIKAQKYTLFTWSKQVGIKRRIIMRAKGIYFWDDKGRKYLDFASQQINVNLGHSHPRIVKVINSQVRTLLYSAPVFANEPKAELGELLIKLTGLAKAFFTTGGGEANENAILIARQYSGKDVIIGRNLSYHGATYAARSAGIDLTRTIPDKHRPPYFEHFSTPYCSKKPLTDTSHTTCCQASLEELRSIINKHRKNIAAVILEPIPGAHGVLIPSQNYLPELVKMCRENKIMVIFDEVMTGFGRTGKWFSYQHWGLKPDIVTVAKGINGASVPLGAVIVSKKIADYFKNNKLLAGLTNSGHPLACAAAVETIKVYKEENLIDNSAKLGADLENYLEKLRTKYSELVDIRSIGLFACLDFSRNDSKEESNRLVEKITESAYREGLFLYHRLNQIILAPPLVINEKQLNVGLEIFEKVLRRHLSIITT